MPLGEICQGRQRIDYASWRLWKSWRERHGIARRGAAGRASDAVCAGVGAETTTRTHDRNAVNSGLRGASSRRARKRVGGLGYKEAVGALGRCIRGCQGGGGVTAGTSSTRRNVPRNDPIHLRLVQPPGRPCAPDAQWQRYKAGKKQGLHTSLLEHQSLRLGPRPTVTKMARHISSIRPPG
jgi:hypothetical protein